MPILGTHWLPRVWSGHAALGEPRHLAGALLKAMLFTMWFGLTTTTYTLFVRGHDYQWQVLASLIKAPLLLLLSLLVAFVPLYAMGRVLRLGLSAIQLWRLAGASVAVMGLALAPLGFLIAAACMSRNYSIVILSTYAAFMVAGLAGVVFFGVALRRSDYVRGRAAAPMPPAAQPPRASGKANALAIGWALCFGLIAAQIGWNIRPLVGWTGQPFSWFRHDDMHIYEQVYYELVNLTHGGGARFPEPAAPDQPHR